jgi:Flp pilus assembly pilin Flp
VRRLPSWLLRALRDDSGLTAVEYAVLCGLVIAVAGAAAFWLGQGVHKSSGKVAWAGNSSGSANGGHASTAGSRLITPVASTAVFGSVLPWALLSLGATVGCAGAFFGWHYLREQVRHGQTRRRVRQSMADANGQAVLARLMPGSSGSPNVRYKRPDTGLIGRHSPNLHHWLRGKDVSVTAEIADVTSPHQSGVLQQIPAPLPAVPVAG